MNEPKIAVLIPVYNEEIVIGETISALMQSDVSRSDIFVVNDCSTDNTAAAAASFGVNVATCPANGGKARAQKFALEHFQLLEKYDWIIFLDGDTKVELQFFTTLFEAAVNEPDVALFVGQVKSAKNDHIYSAFRALEYTYGQDVAKTGQSNFNVIFVSPGCASMYRTDVLKGLDIDHSTLAEDMDLTLQVHRSGGRVKYLERAAVITQDPATFKDYHKQILRWSRGFWQVALKHQIFGFTKKQRVDLYMILLSVDALLFNPFLWAVVIGFLEPTWFPLMACLNAGTMFAISVYAAFRTGRKDVVYKFPVYYWVSFVNHYAFIRAFIEIILLRKTILAWNKVARYDFNQGLKKGT